MSYRQEQRALSEQAWENAKFLTILKAVKNYIENFIPDFSLIDRY